ncbi:MAG: hypothetical protein J6Y91_06205, partial [Alphaproteobacteria bacterium]|nr:hypothetical protein [Alphaproteobacteria bacterium]
PAPQFEDALADAFAETPKEPEPEAAEIPLQEKVEMEASQPEEPKKEAKEEPKEEPEKPKIRSSRYADALQKIRSALSTGEIVPVNNIEDAPVSLVPDDNFSTVLQKTLEDAQREQEEAAVQNEAWEYVDENGNPVAADDGTEWEYVDENGNPITDDGNTEWEYVDENNNAAADNPDNAKNAEPAAVETAAEDTQQDDDDEWDYVDDNNNPIG